MVATLRRCLHPSFLLIQLTLALTAGILLSQVINPPLIHFWRVVLVMTLATSFLCLTSSRWRQPAIIALFLASGLLHGSYALHPPLPPHHLKNHTTPGKPQTIIATLLRVPEQSAVKSQLLVEAHELLLRPRPQHGQQNSSDIQSITVCGRLRLNVHGQIPSLRPGMTLLIQGRFHPPHGFRNPGGYDYTEHLARQRIFLTGWIGHPEFIQPLPSAAEQNGILLTAEKIRAKIIMFLQTHLPANQAALYRALLTGDRSGIDQATSDAFRRLGISHLLAISGLHMAMLASGFFMIATFLLRRSTPLLLHLPATKIAAGLTLIPLAAYALLSGMQPSALRAFIMVTIVMMAMISDRQWHGPTGLALAALLILTFDPLALFTISFQLSFVAVSGIVLILPKLAPYFQPEPPSSLTAHLRRWLGGSLAVAVAAIAATLPLLLFHFQHTSLVGLPATLLFEPLFCLWGLGWGLAALPLVFFWPSLATTLLTMGGHGLALCQQWAISLAGFDQISIWLPPPAIPIILLYYMGILLFFSSVRPQIRLGGLLFCLPLFFPLPHHIDHDQVTILDVGKGNCALIELANGATVLIDGGGHQSAHFDIGRQVIAPFLRQRHIRHLDLVISSHADSDHYNGLFFILDHFACSTLWVADKDSKDAGFQRLLSLARSNHIPVVIPRPGQCFPQHGPSQLRLFSSLHLVPGTTDNDQSLVISFRTGPFSFLFPGDISSKAEQALIPTLPPHDVVIAPHHGSALSNSTPFITTTAPQLVIFSNSPYNKGRFPGQVVQQRYQQQNVLTMQTANKGAIRLLPTARSLDVLTFQPSQHTFHTIFSLTPRSQPSSKPRNSNTTP